ncbi:rRNA methyltransferase 2, mitochondrial [Venturia canescens]|uniref:rRNA methyltransferase 2, mitochondrial n=1 Tax=Venturia canescens TaxID=32260 RepID=UPI001C9BE1DC|nr:rRNA methyltransferase 2, mitochondrial [Venturia canescens]
MSLCRTILYCGFHTCSILLRETPKNLKGKKPSSQHWLTRQLRDPYVEKAKQENYRCRSAFKLLEINERFGILRPGMTVVDCGAAPGSWTQVAVKKTNADGKDSEERKRGRVIAIDRLPICSIEGATVIGNTDFTEEKAQERLLGALEGKLADIVMSDMAPNATGVREMDHENIMKLAYAALKFALGITRTEGNFIAKVWDGDLANQLEKDLSCFYKSVKVVRPGATRSESAEKFMLARGFRGLKIMS